MEWLSTSIVLYEQQQFYGRACQLSDGLSGLEVGSCETCDLKQQLGSALSTVEGFAEEQELRGFLRQ